MELVFHKENGLYITEFEVTSDFNVHLERSKGGKVSFYQKTTDGNYDHIEKLSKNIDKVFDYDFQALVYPKIIKITSECEFDVASLSTDGEVTEIKSQSKEVEIVSNGVTEIAPDAGFGYLSGVKVNVNVPTGGGDAPSGEGESSIEYLDISGMESTQKLITFILSAILAKVSGGPIASAGGIALEGGAEGIATISAISVNLSYKIYSQGYWMTIREALVGAIGEDTLSSIPRITEEEFYNLEA